MVPVNELLSKAPELLDARPMLPLMPMCGNIRDGDANLSRLNLQLVFRCLHVGPGAAGSHPGCPARPRALAGDTDHYFRDPTGRGQCRLPVRQQIGTGCPRRLQSWLLACRREIFQLWDRCPVFSRFDRADVTRVRAGDASVVPLLVGGHQGSCSATLPQGFQPSLQCADFHVLVRDVGQQQDQQFVVVVHPLVETGVGGFHFGGTGPRNPVLQDAFSEEPKLLKNGWKCPAGCRRVYDDIRREKTVPLPVGVAP